MSPVGEMKTVSVTIRIFHYIENADAIGTLKIVLFMEVSALKRLSLTRKIQIWAVRFIESVRLLCPS